MAAIVIPVDGIVNQVHILHIQDFRTQLFPQAQGSVAGTLPFLRNLAGQICQHRRNIIFQTVSHKSFHIAQCNRGFLQTIGGIQQRRLLQRIDLHPGLCTFFSGQISKALQPPLHHFRIQFLPTVMVHVQWEQQFHPVSLVRENVPHRLNLQTGQRIGVEQLMGQTHLHFRIVRTRKQHIQHGDLGLVLFHGQPHFPVAGSQGGPVPAQIISGDSVILPQFHGVNAIDHMTGTEEENIILPVVPKESAIFFRPVRNSQGTAQEEDAGNYQRQQHQHTDNALKT